MPCVYDDKKITRDLWRSELEYEKIHSDQSQTTQSYFVFERDSTKYNNAKLFYGESESATATRRTIADCTDFAVTSRNTNRFI